MKSIDLSLLRSKATSTQPQEPESRLSLYDHEVEALGEVLMEFNEKFRGRSVSPRLVDEMQKWLEDRCIQKAKLFVRFNYDMVDNVPQITPIARVTAESERDIERDVWEVNQTTPEDDELNPLRDALE